jgi:hypothetical protein
MYSYLRSTYLPTEKILIMAETIGGGKWPKCFVGQFVNFPLEIRRKLFRDCFSEGGKYDHAGSGRFSSVYQHTRRS